MNDRSEPMAFIFVGSADSQRGSTTDEKGNFEIEDVPAGTYHLVIAASGYKRKDLKIIVPADVLMIKLETQNSDLDEVVITGTMKEISKEDSPINIDIITPKLFQKTATPNLFEATAMVNGVKPQINCNVCNTGDIHINGMEGPYTLVLIDGMPIVSGLSSVYGLMGIPASMIERLEIAKGPAGALYGSEAMGGTINLITKRVSNAPLFYMDYYTSSYLENNLDLSTKVKIGKKVNWLIGANVFFYDNKTDLNKDGFTDVTLQKRLSLFNKISIERKSGKEFTMAARFVGEDRWGGQMNWEKKFWGGDSIYGESILTQRGEFISKYEWPGREKIYTQVSYNVHDQNSVYGIMPFIAKQSTAFTQTYWNKSLGSRNDLLIGIAYKNLWYDDNTAATGTAGGLNSPEKSNTVGLFIQEESVLDSLSKHRLLFGARLDYNEVYKFVPSPRLAYKWAPNYRFTYRLNAGTGFRIVNVFTEDHAALSGAREVVFNDEIRPEKSYNASANMVYKMKASRTAMVIWDASLFYYYFTNKIVANYDVDPNKIIYDNLNGYAFSKGLSVSASLASPGNFKCNLAFTYADVRTVDKNDLGIYESKQQLVSPKWSGTFLMSYQFPSQQFKIDVTGNWYGPQRLPILPNDYRPEYSPWFCLLNLQFTKTIRENWELYAGGKNLLNFLPYDPIMRPQDPFDKMSSDPVANPNGYTFDPSYSYAPMQGIRIYLGCRITLQ